MRPASARRRATLTACQAVAVRLRRGLFDGGLRCANPPSFRRAAMPWHHGQSKDVGCH